MDSLYLRALASLIGTEAEKKAVFEALESRLDVNLPTSEGLDTMACMEAAGDGFETRMLGAFSVKGRAKKVEVLLLAGQDQTSPGQTKL